MRDAERELLEGLYRERRRNAREVTLESFDWHEPPIVLTDIRRNALTAAAKWHGRRVNWDWELLARKYSQIPKRVELAIWVEGTLCGLCYGKVTEGRLIARIDRLERDPGDVHLTGLVGEVATRFLDLMGVSCRCERAVIWSPAPELLAYYEVLGYTIRMESDRQGVIGLAKMLPVG